MIELIVHRVTIQCDAVNFYIEIVWSGTLQTIKCINDYILDHRF